MDCLRFGRRTRPRQSFGRDRESGTAAIEFALFTPFLLVLLGGVTEIGFAMYESMQVNAAVEAGTMYAAANASSIITNGLNPAAVNSAMSSASTLPSSYTLTPTTLPLFCGCPNAAGSVTTVSCSTTACTPGTYVQVSATLNHLVLMPTSFGIPSTFTATAMIRIN